jgi:FkbM family methyltransferase
LRSYMHRTKLLLGSVYHLQNWKHLRQMAALARQGTPVAERPVLCFRNGLRISLVPGSYANWDYLFYEIFLEKCYQPAPDFIPRKGWTVVDLGANMGFFTCKTTFENAGVRVVAVEPLFPYAETLRGNLKDNRLLNAQVVEGAICGEPNRNIPIQVWYTEAGELKTGTIPESAAKVETLNAKGYTLAEVFQLGKVGRCDLLKVDIEGAEYELFEKIPGEIWGKIQRIVMEVHNDNTHSEKEIVQVLEKNNFKVHLKSDGASTSMLWATR